MPGRFICLLGLTSKSLLEIVELPRSRGLELDALDGTHFAYHSSRLSFCQEIARPARVKRPDMCCMHVVQQVKNNQHLPSGAVQSSSKHTGKVQHPVMAMQAFCWLMRDRHTEARKHLLSSMNSFVQTPFSTCSARSARISRLAQG